MSPQRSSSSGFYPWVSPTEISPGSTNLYTKLCCVDVLFGLYMLPLGQLIRSYNVSDHNYADDTQIYVSLTSGEHGPVDTLCPCIGQISVWMQNNFLQLNSDKTEVIVCGPQKQRESVISRLETLPIKPNNQVRNLGVILDSDLNSNSHIKAITSAAFYHLKNIARIKGIVSKPD